MADFSTTAQLELEITSSELRNARSRIEQELGSVEVGVNASGSGEGGRQLGGILDSNRQQVALLEEQNVFLDEIQEALTGGDLAIGGGGGGGGGGGNIFQNIGAGALGGRIGGAAGGAGATGLLGGLGLLGGGVAAAGGLLGIQTIRGLMGADTPGRVQARQMQSQVAQQGRRGNLPGSRFDSSAAFSLADALNNFSWPEPPRGGPVELTPSQQVASERADAQALEAQRRRRGELTAEQRRQERVTNRINNTLDVTVQTEQDVDAVVDELSRQQDRNLEQFRREIERSIQNR